MGWSAYIVAHAIRSVYSCAHNHRPAARRHVARLGVHRDEDPIHAARGAPPHHGDHGRRARQRRLLRAAARPAAREEDGELRRAVRVPPLLRRRGRSARFDPHVLRVPGRRTRARRRRDGPRDPVARRQPRGDRRSGSSACATPARPRTATAACCCSATPRASRTSCIVADGADAPLAAHAPDIPDEHALQGFHGVRAYASIPIAARDLLIALGFARDGRRAPVADSPASERHATYLATTAAPPDRGIQGAGTIHHVAWSARRRRRARRRSAQRAAAAGAHATPIIDRQYFHSVYFREPSGVLFELASRDIGFARRRAGRDARRDAAAPAAARAPARAPRAAADADRQPARLVSHDAPGDARPRRPPGARRAAGCAGAAPRPRRRRAGPAAVPRPARPAAPAHRHHARRTAAAAARRTPLVHRAARRLPRPRDVPRELRTARGLPRRDPRGDRRALGADRARRASRRAG